jgi:hypothetical protein
VSDPLEALVARSVGGVVSNVRVEDLPADGAIERKRIRYTRDAQAETALFERAPRGEALEAQLVPFLARKTDRVPRVHARGIPPPHAALGPWLLLEDTGGTACDDVDAVVDAKVAIERAVGRDGPALTALGVPVRAPEDLVRERGGGDDDLAAARALASWPVGLVHGELTCERSRQTARGAVLVRWSAASLGCTLLDAARLADDLRARGRSGDADRALVRYLTAHGVPESPLAAAAERVVRLLQGDAAR